MYFDLAFLTIPLRILKEKLNLYHHISCLPDSAIASKVLLLQQRLHLPGLHQDVGSFLKENEIFDAKSFSKVEWKTMIKRKIKSLNRANLIEAARNYKKIDYLSLACEEYETKEYFMNLDLNRARIKFRERAKCMKTCMTHFPSDFNNLKAGYECLSCKEGKIDTLSHWRECSSFSMFRKHRNLDLDHDLIDYYNDIIQLRTAEMER